MVRVELAEGLHDIVDVDLPVLGRHPGVRVSVALVLSLGYLHRLHALRELDALGVGVGDEALEPALETEAVVKHQISPLSPGDVIRCWLVVVYLGTGLGDGLHV